MQQSNNHEITKIININMNQILFALNKNNKTGKVSFKSPIRDYVSTLLGKQIAITVENRRGKTIIYTFEILDIVKEPEPSTNHRLYFKCLETNNLFDYQSKVITNLINTYENLEETQTCVRLVNIFVFGDDISRVGISVNKSEHKDWKPLFTEKLKTHDYGSGVYVISGTINNIKYYYVGITDNFQIRFTQHWEVGYGGRYEVYTNELLRASDGKMEAIAVMEECFNHKFMENVMETVFASLFELHGVYVINGLNTGKYKTKKQLLGLLFDNTKSDNLMNQVRIFWNPFRRIESYSHLLRNNACISRDDETDNNFLIRDEYCYFNECYNLIYDCNIPTSLFQLLDRLQVTLEEFVKVGLTTVKRNIRQLGKRSDDYDKQFPIALPKGKSKNRFDGFLGYRYNPNPKFNKTKQYWKLGESNLTVKEMEALVLKEIHKNTHKLVSARVEAHQEINVLTGKCEMIIDYVMLNFGKEVLLVKRKNGEMIVENRSGNM